MTLPPRFWLMDFLDRIQEWDELWDLLAYTRKAATKAEGAERFMLDTKVFQLEEAGLASYLRPRHATKERYRQLIEMLRTQSNRTDLFEYKGVSFSDQLIDICVSHNLDASVLAEVKGTYEERYPRQLALGGVYLNAQFCAAVLRLTDVLDLDRERTPRILFESLGIARRHLPGADLSVREWNKHMAIHTVEINKDEIVISAESQHPVIEKTIRDFCLYIEREARDTLAVLKRNSADVLQRYAIEFPVTVRPSIRPNGYVFKDMSLSLNQPRVTALLMGERLYSDPSVAVRELIQNAIDACAAQLEIEGDSYHPSISLSVTADAEGTWLEVSDNGLGMDEHVLSEYFLKLGNSYYGSPEFQRLLRNQSSRQFTPISRFGIGILSVYLIGDLLEVVTKASHSPRQDSLLRTLRIEKLGALAFVTESNSGESGTRVRVRLHQRYADASGFLRSLPQYLRRTIVRPRFPIKVRIFNQESALTYRLGIKLKPNAHEVLAARGIESILLDLGRWSNKIKGSG